MRIKWSQATSQCFTISNGVRQGCLFSSRLFVVHVDNFSKHLIYVRSGCFIEDQCINLVMYADDICFLAPRALRLKKPLLVNVCDSFG